MKIDPLIWGMLTCFLIVIVISIGFNLYVNNLENNKEIINLPKEQSINVVASNLTYYELVSPKELLKNDQET